jgi:hypothetical protein
MVQTEAFVMLSAVLFVMGTLGVLVRRQCNFGFHVGGVDVERGKPFVCCVC